MEVFNVQLSSYVIKEIPKLKLKIEIMASVWDVYNKVANSMYSKRVYV